MPTKRKETGKTKPCQLSETLTGIGQLTYPSFLPVEWRHIGDESKVSTERYGSYADNRLPALLVCGVSGGGTPLHLNLREEVPGLQDRRSKDSTRHRTQRICRRLSY